MAPEPFSWSIAGNLELGERVQAFTSAEVQIGQADFRPAQVVLTDRRLLVLLPIPGGQPVVRSFDRHACSAIQHRERDDGSLLVALKAGGALLGLVIQQWNREDAEPLLIAVGVEVATSDSPVPRAAAGYR